jgi:hypothetical protein
MTTNYCSQCGKPIQPADRYCQTCGAALGEPEPAEPPQLEHKPGASRPPLRTWLARTAFVFLLAGLAFSVLNPKAQNEGLTFLSQAAFLLAALVFLALIVHLRWQAKPKQTAAALLAAGVILVVGFGYLAVSRSRSIDEQLRLLHSPDSQLRANAAYALGQKKAATAVDALLEALQDEDEHVRSAAASALGSIGTERAVMPLIAALQREEDDVRMSVIHALGQLGDERAVNPLLEQLWGGTTTLQGAAARALGNVGEPAVEPLIAALADFSPLRYYTAMALGEIDDPRAAQALLTRLAQGDTLVGAGAHRFFINRGEPGSEEKLVQALYDYGDVSMATTYLNCENKVLQKAAETWAASHGYTIYATPGGSGAAAWGSSR